MSSAYIFTIDNPADNSKLDIRFEEDDLTRIYKYRPVEFQNIEVAVIKVLEKPNRIFKGIIRPVSVNGWCFVGQPDEWYIRKNVLVPFDKNKYVYAVFLNDRMSVYDFRAEYRDQEDTLSPKDWKNRFGVLIWKKIF